MSPLGLELYYWLQDKDGVAELRDESTTSFGDAISCTYGGKRHLITLTSANPMTPLADPREVLDALNDEENNW